MIGSPGDHGFSWTIPEEYRKHLQDILSHGISSAAGSNSKLTGTHAIGTKPNGDSQISADVIDLIKKTLIVLWEIIKRVKMKTNKKFIMVIIGLCTAVSCGAQVDYKTDSYANAHRVFNTSDDRLQNPTHHMTESILFDQSKISATGSGVYMQGGAVNYYTSFDYIPVPKRLLDATTQNCVDYAYRGKIILFGEEYYVREVAYPSYISAYKGMILDNVSNKSFAYYGGYGFRTDEIVLDCGGESCWLSGANISVRKPTGQIFSNITVKNYADYAIDNLIISINALAYVPKGRPIELVSSLLIYNTSTEAVLENGYTLEMAGIVKTGWMVSLFAQKQPFDAGMDIAEYANIAPNQYLLKNATISYTRPVTLNMSNYLNLPAGYKIVSDGTSLGVTYIYSTTTTTTTTTTSSTTTTLTDCELNGDLPPCAEISLSEVITYINAWAAGTANLNAVIALINAWASG